MSLVIKINDRELDVNENQNFSITGQVNDFSELKKRQYSFTNSISLPKTVNNKDILDFMSYPGNTSTYPYNKVSGVKLSLNGIPIVNDGYAIVSSSNKSYKIAVYYGSISFYEAIKDLTLKDLDWSDLDHLYSESTMEASWSNTSGYIYPVCDVIEGQREDVCYFDLPAPMVFAKDIISKIADISMFDIQGSIFSDLIFDKTIISTENSIKLDNYNISSTASDSRTDNITTDTSYIESDPPIVTSTNGYHKLKISWNYTTTTGTVPTVNIEADGLPRTTVVLVGTQGDEEVFVHGTSFEAVLNAVNPDGIQTSITLDLEASLLSFSSKQVTFSELMPDISLAEFLKQIMTHFCLNIYPDIKNKTVHLDLINDFENAEIVDISKFYDYTKSEDYKIGGYSSNNIFKYAIEDENEDYSYGELAYSSNDGLTKTYFTSKFTQPSFNSYEFNKYEHILFNEDIEPEEGKIKIFTTKTVSNTIKISQHNSVNGKEVSNYTACDFSELKFSNSINRYYKFIISRLFKSPVKKTVETTIGVVDFYNIDYRKLYYISNESSLFMLNKINKRSEGKTSLELIQVGKTIDVNTLPVAVIEGDLLYTTNSIQTIDALLLGENSYSDGGYITNYFWEVKDESNVSLFTSNDPNLTFQITTGDIRNIELTVTNELGNQNTTSVQVVSALELASGSPTSFQEQTVVLSDFCYTVKQTKLKGTANGTFNLRVTTTITNGGANTEIYSPLAIGQSCTLGGCAGLGSITDSGSIDLAISLDSLGDAYIQIVLEGVKDPLSPTSNETNIFLKDLDTGEIIQFINRQWSKTEYC